MLHAPRLRRRLGAVALLCLTAASLAQPPDREALNRQPDNAGTGRYAAMKEEVASLPAHVVYRPADLASLGSQRLGVVAWGNGGCSDDGASSRFHLLELASHGYLVIASGRIFSGPGAAAREPAAAGAAAGPAAPRTRAAQLTEAIDWALQENQRSGSPLFGRIDPAQVAVAGFSCGGIQALAVAADPRIRAMLLQNTGIFNDAGPAGAVSSEMNLTKAALQNVHAPTLYILGGDTDIAYANGMDDFQRIDHVPVAVANLLGVGHGGSYAEPNGGAAAQAAVRWLDWTLRGDAPAGAWFLGDSCTLCTDAKWSFAGKGLK